MERKPWNEIFGCDHPMHRFTRYTQIADIFRKYGFGMVLEGFIPGLPRIPRIRLRSETAGLSPYTRIRMMLEELGPTYIKLGQIMSTRTELFPPALIDELNRLTDSVTPVPFSELRPVIEEQCGEIAAVFSSIDETPLGAASLAQVHRAVLKSGREVVLKIQRPGIEELIEIDLGILESLARHIEKRYPHTWVYNPTGMIREFSIQIARELDFVRDGKNAEILAGNLKDIPEVKIPKIFWEHSGRRMLVMEYIEGVRIDDLEGIRERGVRPREVAEIVLSAYLKQIFQDGFFHGDPHPGNILVTGDGRVAFLDFGIVGVLRPAKREAFVRLLLGMVENDVDMVVESYQDLGIRIRDEDLEGLKDDTYAVLQDYQEYEVQQVEFRGVMVRIPDILRKYHLQVPLSMMLMIKVIMMMISINSRIDPSFNFPSRVDPYLKEILRHQYLSAEKARRTATTVVTSMESYLELPKSLNQTFKRIAEGRLKLEIIDMDMRELSHAVKYASSIVLLGLVASALVIGASLVVLATQPSLAGIACSRIMSLTLLGYLFAVALAVFAIYWVVVKKKPEKG
jgi:ubiquinone biosynthesis protein